MLCLLQRCFRMTAHFFQVRSAVITKQAFWEGLGVWLGMWQTSREKALCYWAQISQIRSEQHKWKRHKLAPKTLSSQGRICRLLLQMQSSEVPSALFWVVVSEPEAEGCSVLKSPACLPSIHAFSCRKEVHKRYAVCHTLPQFLPWFFFFFKVFF